MVTAVCGGEQTFAGAVSVSQLIRSSILLDVSLRSSCPGLLMRFFRLQVVIFLSTPAQAAKTCSKLMQLPQNQ